MPRIKKVLITEFGDESKLKVVEADISDPAAGQVQVKVEYSSVSGADIKMREGTYPFQRKAPLTPGYSIVGKVQANGAGSSKFKVGNHVACLTIYDGQSELINLPERLLASVPEKADPKPAVGIILDWMTAYQMLTRSAHVKPGQRIFVHGLSGAVGQALLHLAKLQGVEVFGTASPAKLDDLKKLGATPFSYTDKNWITAIQSRDGVDAVFDPLGFRSFDESESILRPKGILVGYGMNLPTLTKTRPPYPALLEFIRIFAKNLKFWTGKRSTFYGINRNSAHYLPDLTTLLQMLADGKISVPIKAEFKMDDIREAHKNWASGPGMGTIVIQVQE
jgi:NADPH:quinone reductase-like Zn-dependent oxidoreductase